jgi:hypothetical protein
MPSSHPVARKELASAWARETEDVLEVRGGRGERTRDGRVERASNGGEQQHGCDSRGDLELAIDDVLVRHPVAGEVEEHAERNRCTS